MGRARRGDPGARVGVFGREARRRRSGGTRSPPGPAGPGEIGVRSPASSPQAANLRSAQPIPPDPSPAASPNRPSGGDVWHNGRTPNREGLAAPAHGRWAWRCRTSNGILVGVATAVHRTGGGGTTRGPADAETRSPPGPAGPGVVAFAPPQVRRKRRTCAPLTLRAPTLAGGPPAIGPRAGRLVEGGRGRWAGGPPAREARWGAGTPPAASPNRPPRGGAWHNGGTPNREGLAAPAHGRWAWRCRTSNGILVGVATAVHRTGGGREVATGWAHRPRSVGVAAPKEAGGPGPGGRRRAPARSVAMSNFERYFGGRGDGGAPHRRGRVSSATGPGR